MVSVRDWHQKGILKSEYISQNSASSFMLQARKVSAQKKMYSPFHRFLKLVISSLIFSGDFFLKIGILGAGAMGILYGGLLSNKGNDVKFIIKNESKKKIINEEGIKLNIDGKSFTVNPKAILAEETNEFNLIIIFTKTNDTISALNSIKHSINKNTFLMSLQNGLGNLEKLLKFSDSSKIIYGTTMAPADLKNLREVSSFGSHVSQFRLARDKNNGYVKDISNIFGFHSPLTYLEW